MLDSWISEIREHSHPEIKIFLIGNKIDLNSERQVTYEEAINFMNKNKLDFFEETSAKEGMNIEEIFKKGIILLFSGYCKLMQSFPSSSCDSSVYGSLNSKNSLQLRQDVNKVKDKNESDSLEKQNYCLC